MSELAVDCRSVTKVYRLGELLSLKNTLSALTRRHRGESGGFKALDSVTFTVSAGAFFGIVGSNGSGKSTLTQVMSGITVPTSGEVALQGRILPLLEVGAGFHDELTGRENVQLLGAVLGIPPAQVAGAMDAIVEFAGVERHFDTPLKRYSSGMKARLSFATAVCFPADIYVFDEVLAVVDDDFRDQCIAEMRALNRAGSTIIFMSHDLRLVEAMCDEGMWLEQGLVRQTGSIEDVAAAYAASSQYQKTLAAASARAN